MAKAPTFREAFSALVAAPTVSSIEPAHDQGNLPAANLLANWFSDLGFATELIPVGGRSDKVNVVASLGAGTGGLVLSGHTDTVPFTESAWRQDPFTLTEKDGRFYGLGTSDMKCFFPIVMEALRALEPKRLRRPLILLATCDEESTMAGARALVEADRRLGRHALIGEPTGLQPVNMHKGVMIETITLKGQAGHSSDPSLGNSAMEGMHAVLGALMTWREELQESFSSDHFKVPVPTLNLGCIRGGDSPNRICAECELKIDLRLLPRMKIDEVRKALQQTVANAVAGSGLQLEFSQVLPGISPLETDPASEIVKLAEQLTGHPAGTVSFATEGPWLNALGMDTVVLGPGDIEQAHQANEYIEGARIPPMQDIVQKMIAHFCLERGHEQG